MTIAQFPHCDQRILHEPGRCRFCDLHPEWQELRKAWGISFTGVIPAGGMLSLYGSIKEKVFTRAWSFVDKDGHTSALPCPADFARPPESPSDHRRWGGNVAMPAEEVRESDSEPLGQRRRRLRLARRAAGRS